LISLLAALLLAPSMAWSETAVLYQQKLGQQDRAAFSPEIAVSHDGEVFVMWLDRDMPTGPPPKRKPGEHSHRSAVDLWIARSENGGASFQAPSRVNRESGVIWGFQVSKPRVSTDKQGVVHISYPANDVSAQTRLDVVASHYTRSIDKGATFSEPLTLNSHVNKDGRGLLGEELGAAHAFGTMAVAPDGDGSRDSVVRRSNDRGATWLEPARLPIDPWYINGCPLKPTDMAVNDRYVYSVSYSAGPEHKGVWFSRSRNGAMDFEEAAPVHPASKYSDAPVITVTPSGVVRIVWHSREGRKSPYRLFMAESYDHGETFTDPWLLPTPEGDSRFPVISTARDGTAHIAWEQRVKIGDIVTTEVHVMGVAAPVPMPETVTASLEGSEE